ncbi:caskin-2 isoform X2 [Anabrus simplex]|uniref:caskin-2 isoform X2 n=1 Tax=Anabrus simplex TaxID=316456 RepID=UPI0035A340A1
MMATCFGPPPLPPNKKSLLGTSDGQCNTRLKKQQQMNSRKHRELSSTYLSFKEPAEDEIIVVASEDLEVEFITSKASSRRGLMTNSLSRKVAMSASTKTIPLSLLSRSHSDSNLSQRRRGSSSRSFTTATGTLNRCLRALGSSWKNLLHLGGMSRPPKPAPQVKKVAPPAVPDVFRHSGSSFGSAGYSSSSEDGFITPADTQPPREGCDHGEVYAMAGKSPGPQFSYPAFTFPGPQGVQGYTQLMHAGKGAAYYHHQLSLQEDQGIDMTQSPGRDSPGSSGSGSGSGSRHSTASLDSGRASGYHLLGPTAPRSTMGGLGPGCSLSSSPRCSLSSSSLGSSEHGGPAGRVERLLSQGVPDQDVIHTWLLDLHFEEYFPLFASAGYDMPTISKMTPEDLTAIGIKKPNHRKKLKAEIAQLSISDGLPDYIPGSMEEWLRLLRLEEYGPALLQQGYKTVEDVTQLTWEDLEDIGIVKLGHQKKILLAIKRVKDIRAGKRFPTLQTAGLDLSRLPPHPGQTQVLISTPGGGLNSPDEGDCYVHSTFHAYHQPWEVESSQHMSSSFGHVFSTNTTTAPQFFQPMYCPDIVPIKIRGGRGKSLESLEDSSERTHHTFSAENTQTFYYQQMAPGPGGWRPRSYDDGDITPTNEAVALHEGGGTLPRPRGLVRPRPVAKITAKTREGSSFAIPDFEKPAFCGTYKSLPRDLIDISKYNLEQYSGVHYSAEIQPAGNESPRCTPKKRPPSPPKRQSSRTGDLGVDIRTNSSDVVIDCSGPVPKATDSRNQTTVTVDLHSTTSSPLSLPAYPSSDELALSGDTEDELPLPPPPAPSSPPGLREKFEGLSTLSRSWSTMPTSDSHSTSSVEQELINSLAMQQCRNGSDASFKSSSSTESDSLPFANENAGTIKQRATRPHPQLSTMDYPNSDYVPPKRVQNPQGDLAASQKALRERPATQEPADVLNDIGNMLANLTDELDAMLEEEKRQGLNQ